MKFNFHKYFISRCFNAHTRTHIFGFSDSGIFFFSQQYLKLTWQLARFMAFNFIRQCLANCFESETESCKQYCVCVNDRQLGTDMVSKIAATCSKFHIVYWLQHTQTHSRQALAQFSLFKINCKCFKENNDKLCIIL